jgi:hypothetical protein
MGGARAEQGREQARQGDDNRNQTPRLSGSRTQSVGLYARWRTIGGGDRSRRRGPSTRLDNGCGSHHDPGDFGAWRLRHDPDLEGPLLPRGR